MDNLFGVLKAYDADDDGLLTNVEFNKFCEDVDYNFSEKEIDIFDLRNDFVSFDQIQNAIEFEDYDFSDQHFMNILRSLDKDNSGKVFVPELINILKTSPEFSNQNKLDELIVNLPIEEHYLIIDKI